MAGDFDETPDCFKEHIVLHVLVAHAQTEGLTIITEDSKIEAYPVAAFW